MTILKEKRTTHIWFGEYEDVAHIETCNKKFINRINLYFGYDLYYSAAIDGEFGVECDFPRKCVAIRKPTKKEIELLKSDPHNIVDNTEQLQGTNTKKGIYTLPKEDRETHICFTEADDKAYVSTNNKVLMRRLDEHSKLYPGFIVRFRDFNMGDYIIPKRCLLIRKPTVISNENRAEKALQCKRLNKLRCAQNKDKEN